MQAIIDQQREFVAPVAWEKFKKQMLERKIAEENFHANLAEVQDVLENQAVFSKFLNGGSG